MGDQELQARDVLMAGATTHSNMRIRESIRAIERHTRQVSDVLESLKSSKEKFSEIKASLDSSGDSLSEESLSTLNVLEAREYFSSLTSQSIFTSIPTVISVASKQMIYDPELASVIASVISSETPLGSLSFEQILLPHKGLSDQGPCQGDMTAYVSYGDAEAPVFVVLPGSYSQFLHGFYARGVIRELQEIYPGSTFITFDGFLSPPFLSSSCQTLPWPSQALSEDIYARLQAFFQRQGFRSELTGLLGFSGGGTIALELMALDGNEGSGDVHDSEHPSLFGLGAFVASPVLHERVAFTHFDDRYDHRTGGLSTLPWALSLLPQGVLSWLLSAKSPISEALYDAYREDPDDFKQRVWNEFVSVDLRDALITVGILPDGKGYVQAYEKVTGQSIDATAHPCLAYNPVERTLDKITGSTVIAFSLDDPFLSDIPARGYQKSCVGLILDYIKHLPHMHLYAPAASAHLGVLIDPLLSDLLKFAFSGALAHPSAA